MQSSLSSSSLNTEAKKKINVQLVHTLKHRTKVSSLRFSPTGKHLAMTCDRTTHVYDTMTGEPIYILADISEKHKIIHINDISFSRDGRYLSTASDDGQIRVWEMFRRRLRNMLKGHKQIVSCLDFSPDGRRLVSGSYDGTVLVWHMIDGTSKKVFGKNGLFGYIVRSVAFSPNGKYVAAGSNDTTIRIWDVCTGHFIVTLKGHSGWVSGLTFTPDGRGLVSGSWDSTLKYWDVSSLGTMRSLKITQNRGTKNKHANTYELAIYSGAKGIEYCLNFIGHEHLISSIAISPNGRWIISGSGDSSARIWDARNAQTQCLLQAHNKYVPAVDFSPAGNHLATSSSDGQVRIWRYDEV